MPSAKGYLDDEFWHDRQNEVVFEEPDHKRARPHVVLSLALVFLVIDYRYGNVEYDGLDLPLV